MNQITNQVPFSIYVHTPWCEKKCPYCDFNSHQNDDVNQGQIPQELEDSYLSALRKDLSASLARHPRLITQSPVSIFIGGGTPSLLSSSFYQRLFSTFAEHFSALELEDMADIDITIEANPSSAEQQKFTEYRQIGINRLSIGAQSFSNSALKSLGRLHSGEEAIEAYDMAHKSGFAKINMDIIYALPKQSTAQVLEDLATALALKDIAHLSFYQLTIEPNTYFANNPPQDIPSEDKIIEMESAAAKLFAEHGFQQYEVSAWSRSPSSQSKHNLNYWQFGDYLGLGAGAHSKITQAFNDADSRQGYKIIREWKHRSPKKYLETEEQIGAKRILAGEEIIYEFMLNALRLVDGFDLSLLPQRTGMTIDSCETAIKQGHDLGLLIMDDDRLAPTARGKQMLNEIIMLFSPTQYNIEHNMEDNIEHNIRKIARA